MRIAEARLGNMMSLRKLGVGVVALITCAACGDTAGKNGDAGPIDSGLEPTTCATDDDCASPFDCRSGVCDLATSTCSYATSPTTCFVDGTCYYAGQEQAGDRCKICEPDRIQEALINKDCPDGTTCEPTTGQCIGDTPDAIADVQPDVALDVPPDPGPDIQPEVVPDVGPDTQP
ncbi:MAG: hypothetical protein GY856_52355, partial [bacterium]|nr:hypothetical protein [bacterium]